LAHDLRRAELQAAIDRDPMRAEQQLHHIAEQRAFGVDLRGDDDRIRCNARYSRRETQEKGESKPGEAGADAQGLIPKPAGR
jgi:hypothetical protein